MRNFSAADVYSFSLVLWEIARRCSLDGEVDDFQVPFHDQVPNDPSFEDMKKIVITDGKRPDLSPRWFQSPYLEGVMRIMTEGWSANANVRPTMLRMKKVLSRLLQMQLDNHKKAIDMK